MEDIFVGMIVTKKCKWSRSVQYEFSILWKRGLQIFKARFYNNVLTSDKFEHKKRLLRYFKIIKNIKSDI